MIYLMTVHNRRNLQKRRNWRNLQKRIKRRMTLKPATRTVEIDQDRLAVKNVKFCSIKKSTSKI